MMSAGMLYVPYGLSNRAMNATPYWQLAWIDVVIDVERTLGISHNRGLAELSHDGVEKYRSSSVPNTSQEHTRLYQLAFKSFRSPEVGAQFQQTFKV